MRTSDISIGVGTLQKNIINNSSGVICFTCWLLINNREKIMTEEYIFEFACI